MHFDWEKYETENGSVLVSSDNLPHHRDGLTSQVCPRVLCEVRAQDDDAFKLVVVRLVCGPLIEVSTVTARDPNNSEEREAKQTRAWSLSSGQWIDSDKRGVFKFGHSRANGGDVPGSLSEDTYTWCEEVGLMKEFTPLTHSYPPGAGLSLVSHVRVGDKFELQSAVDPSAFWRVTVTENVGGLLGLGWDCLESVPNTDLHVHVTEPRLHPCGTVSCTPDASWNVPDQIKVMQYPDQVISALKESFSQVQENKCSLNDYRHQTSLVKHGFDERMLLAVIDPKSEEEFRVAIVEKVLDEFYFVISLLEDTDTKLLCNTNSDTIAPISWAIEKKFMAKASLQNMSCSPLSKIAPKHLFKKMKKYPTNIFVGQKLEYCNNFFDKTFYFCDIVAKQEGILTVDIWTEEGKVTKLISSVNKNIFPPGFSEQHNLKFYHPVHLKFFEKFENEELQSSQEYQGNSPLAETKVDDENRPPFPMLLKSSSLPPDSSSWCPRIYFNHLCYSASFLSKPRLQSLPKFIGSGPVRLVMREVLSRLIGASFKSGAVLKKLEISEERKRRPDYWLETMKGKSRVLVLQADLEIPSKASQVAGFCREVCQKLACCPYLFGPQLVGSECPSACNSRPKSDFQAEGEQGARPSKRGRRGRKRQRVVNTGDKEEGVEERVESDRGSDSGSSSPSCSTTVTTNTTRDNSPDPGDSGTGGTKRKYGPKNWGDILPPSEIKTRGAKLPSFAVQLKVRPSKKDVEELERLIAAKCEPDSPPRPPSPKLLRSRGGGAGDRRHKIHHTKGDASFSFEDLPDADPVPDAPQVWHLTLTSNPATWSAEDVSDYLASKREVAHMAAMFRQEEVDGEAFLLLNLPTLLEHWTLEMSEAINLSRHIESVKLAFYKQLPFLDCVNGRGG